MVSVLSAASQKVDLKLKIVKTQFMTNLVSSCNLMLEGKRDSIRNIVQIPRTQTYELNRRIELTWAAFGRLRHVFKSDILMCLKRKVLETLTLSQNHQYNKNNSTSLC